MRIILSIAVSLVLTTAAVGQEQTFTVANTTPNCRDGNRATHRVCLPEGKRVAERTITKTSSAGNRADIERDGPVPGRPNCWEIVTVVEPKGEDCIKIPLTGNNVCNCKGRGWIELTVRLKPE
jgi:hypothetical protein